jgi:prolyl oligopeptidase
LKYPVTRKTKQVDDYNGAKVADPYRWLEDSDSPETAGWVEAQNKLTFAYLESLPERPRIHELLTRLYNYERFAQPSMEGGRYFLFHNDGLQNQNVLFTMDSPTGTPRVLLDPNTLRADGTAALSSHHASHDGKLLAYAIAQAGSDWVDWHIRDIATGKDLPDLIRWTKGGNVHWTPDNKAFYYTRYPEPPARDTLRAPNENAKIYLHRLGQPQSSDTLVYERPDHPQWSFGAFPTEDGRYLVISIFSQDYGKNLLFYQDLQAPGKTIELINQLTAAYNFLGNRGPLFYFESTDGAPKGKIIAIDVTRPARANWKELLPEQADAIDDIRLLDDRFLVSYLKDAHAYSRIYSLQGKLEQDIELPGLGTVEWSHGSQRDQELFYTFISFTTPASLYRFDMRTRKSAPFRSSRLNFDPNRYQTKQVFCTSKDGTRVPIFLTYKKGITLDGQNPTILYGYGGFNVAVTPAFSARNIAWLEMGGIYASANLRGGSEYGEEWHLAGTRERKQNVFDDFIAAAEWLIQNKFTSTPKLAIFGGSNGGLLVAACLNQRPDLFGAVVAAAGVMDMLRFNQFTVGKAWVGDYGSPQNPADFQVLRAYSPVHNVRKGTRYPPVLITTADHDDRVVPGHSFKYAAAMQEAQEGPGPILIRIETRAGHGAGKPTTKIIEETADMFAFVAHSLGM